MALLSDGNFDESMVGLRVLLHRKNNMKSFFLPLLEAAKRRWNWTVDVFCDEGDGSDYAELVGNSGKIYLMPDMERPAAWESDRQAVFDTNERIRRAEIAARTPIGRLPLASQRNIGVGFVTANWDFDDSDIVRKVLKDNTEPFRMARRYFRYADEILAERAPDFVLTFEWGKPFRFATWLAAVGRGIPCIAARRSKILSDRNFYTIDPLLFNTRALEIARDRKTSRAAMSEAAKLHLERFRERPTMVQYIQDRWQVIGRRRQAEWYLRLLNNAAKDLARAALGRLGNRRSAAKQMIRHYRQLITAHRHERYFTRFDDAALQAMKYIYFPMHKETDISQTFQAAVWHDQRNTIQVLAGSLPGDYRLLVREHRFNRGLRPADYYRRLCQLPNVTLIDALDSQFKYVKHADLIVTENGSAGWEGLLLGRRVITLARTFYDGAGLAKKVKDVNFLGAAIVEALATPAIADQAEHDRALGDMLDAEREATFSIEADGISGALNGLAEALWRARRITGAFGPSSVDVSPPLSAAAEADQKV